MQARSLAPEAAIRLILAVTLLPGLAAAAEVTDMPPALRGDAELVYSGAFLQGPLNEDGERVIGTRHQRHDLDLKLAFSVTDGLAVTAAVATTPSMRVSFTDDGQRMSFDPVDNTGTYQGGAPLSVAPEHTGGGLVGVWLGIAAGPYGRWMKTPDDFSWRIDVGLRVPNRSGTFYEAADDSRGAAPGGTAVRVAGAFATERGSFEPYLHMAYQYESPAIIDIGDPQNGVTVVDATIQAPSTVDLRAGSEIILSKDETSGQRIALDLFATTGYRTRARIGSGVMLPDVIDQSRGIVVSTSEHLVGGGGLGLIVNPNKYIGVRVAGDIRAVTPYRVEHPFDVYQGAGTHQIGVNASVRGHIR